MTLNRTSEFYPPIGIELDLIMLRNRVAGGDLTDANRADIELHLKLLLAHAKLRGWIVDKKQIAKLSASVRLDRAELDAALEADLERLAPGAAGQLARLGRAPSRSDLARIAAGEDVDAVEAGSESEPCPNEPSLKAIVRSG